jgi:trk system potassium uptake protein TrkA
MKKRGGLHHSERQQVSKRRKQVCVIGLGHFGGELAVTLSESCDVLAIDRDQRLVDEIADRVNRAISLNVHDEATLASVLPEGIDESVVSMGGNLESSILCTLYLKRLGVPIVRVKVTSDDHAIVLRQTGADEVIFPERETARRLAARIVNPNLLDFVPLRGGYQVIQMKLPAAFAGQTLAALNLRARYDVLVIAVQRDDLEGTRVMPGPNFLTEPGDLMVMVGREQSLRRLQEIAEVGVTTG